MKHILAILAFAISAMTPFVIRAQPEPGDVFREYLWTLGGNNGGFLRVGGKEDYGGGPITLPQPFDLEHATRAEIVVEKQLCHDGTHDMAISVNSNQWVAVPESPGIPAPQWNYQHLIYPVIPVPLDCLRGSNNQFRLRVSSEHPWNWPESLIYGVHFRVYYDVAKKPHPAGQVDSPEKGAELGTNVELNAEAFSPNGQIRRVDFIGYYEDVNLEGDGNYSQWHYHYVRGVLTNHIGTATSVPWRVTWDTAWVPDQPGPFRVAARITDETGLTYFTKAVEGLSLKRDGWSVELCKPYDVPEKWVTRLGEKTEKFRVNGDLSKAVAAQLVWASWSPGFMDGIFINDQRVFDSEGPLYAYYLLHVPIRDLKVLKPGENLLKTGLSPKRNGKMEHGMEVYWPGIMMLVRYDTTAKPVAFGEKH